MEADRSIIYYNSLKESHIHVDSNLLSKPVQETKGKYIHP